MVMVKRQQNSRMQKAGN